MFYTAGFPAISELAPQCFGRPFKLMCHYQYETNRPPMWLMDGKQVEHNGSQFDINDTDSTLTLQDISQSRYADKETLFQCCVKLISRTQVCGEHYIFDPLGEIHYAFMYVGC